LELLNTALETSAMAPPSPQAIEAEFKVAVKSLKQKYRVYASGSGKGKEKASSEILTGADEMNIG